MPKKPNKKVPSIIRDQLMTKWEFLYFCNHSYVGNDRQRLKITPEFLGAVEKDELIKPLLEETSEEPDENGEKKPHTVKYYSPHHLFMMAGLRRNVLKDGRISSEEQLAWGPEEYRTVLWGSHYGFTVSAATGKPIGKVLQLDLHAIATHLDGFLRILHTLPQLNDYEARGYDKGRHFTMAPNIRFNFSALKKDGIKELKAYGLTVDNLVLLRYSIGSLAAQIDPLEYWYDYLKRHPVWRKDKLKDDALLAHELYLIEELVSEMLEVVTGKPQPPLMQFLHQGSIKPFLMPEVTYAGGVDVKALQTCIAQARKWLKNPTNAKLAPEGSVAALNGVEDQIKEYVKLYGDNRSYISGVPRPAEMDNRPLEELDPITRGYAEDGLKDLDPNDPEYEQDYQLEIGGAISSRLTFLRHDVWEAIDRIGKGVRQERDKAWREYEDSQRQVKSEDEYKRLFLEAKAWDARVDEFSEVLKDYSLIYCQECREKPVQLHYDNGDQQANHEPICDDCFKQIADGELGAKSPIKSGEWRCDYCVDAKGVSPMLYKFAQRNTISLSTVNDVPIKIQLEYGRAVLEAKCRLCHRVQRRKIDWGWVA